jgi:hypothetical protein|tara:strand:- start:1109 stop:1438 length:330 start_codon:yes stop_codon:yes gene_type:complete
MLTYRVIVPNSLKLRRRLVTFRAHKSEHAWDPDDIRRINENKNWKSTDPEEDVWDIDAVRDARRYKRESLEAVFKVKTEEEEETLNKMRERIDKWEQYADREMGSNDWN